MIDTLLAMPKIDAAAMTAGLGETFTKISGLKLPPAALARVQHEYMTDATALWNRTLSAMSGQAGDAAAELDDRRFAAKEWAQNPAASFTAQMYLLNAQALTQMADAVEGDAKTRARLRFAVQQWVDAVAPSNFLALNPEAQQKALQTQGKSLVAGIKHLLEDARKGRVSQTDESAFEVGRNVATTEGAVVFENELIQLIEYKPLTAKVYERPILLVPAFINKYYIMDLQPENSLIRYAVEQGHRTFVISWRNPDMSLAHKTWDDYVEDTVIRAITVVQQISGAKTINTLGFCIGGTILATALGVLAARGEQPASSVTLMTSLLDFSDNGVLDLFIDEAGINLRDMTMGEKAPGGPGLLKGSELATTFSFLRPNELVWNYVVANYLKGEPPPAFDLLYWNGDSTNLPGPMYCWYLRHTYLNNDLKEPGKVTVCGEKLDLRAIGSPVFVYGSLEDHIVPWKSAYLSTRLLTGKRRFVLGASGHIAGVINPPAKKKRNYWTNEQLPADAEDWFAGATSQPGSWWVDWQAWLKPLSGAQVAAPKVPGNRTYKPIEPAPGRYVKQKA